MEDAVDFAKGYERRSKAVWTDRSHSREGGCAGAAVFFKSGREESEGVVIPRRGVLGAGKRREKVRKDDTGGSRRLAGGEGGPGWTTRTFTMLGRHGFRRRAGSLG